MVRRTFLGLAFGFLGSLMVQGQRSRVSKKKYFIDAGPASPESIDLISGGGASDLFPDIYQG